MNPIIRLHLLSAVFLATIACSPTGLHGLRSDQKVNLGKFVESRYVITGKPVFFANRDSPNLVDLDIPPWIENEKLPYGGLDWPATAPSFRQIATEKSYKFEILRSDRVVDDSHPWTDLNLSKVWDGKRLLFDASQCPIHHETMRRRIEFSASAEDYPGNFRKIHQTRFPNDGIAYQACGSGISHIIWLCGVCETESGKWRNQHGIQQIPEDRGL